jgi:hypothetical protein
MLNAVCRRRGPAPFGFGAAGILTFALLVSSAPVHAAKSDNAQDWHLYVGEAVIDTLDGSASEIFAAGNWVLLKDSWTIERKNEAAGTLVTGWKPVRHPLLKLATGAASVRVAVALKSVGPGRTEIRVLGGIAAQEELRGPVLPLAQSAGQHECRGYVTELRARLAEERLSDGAPSASPRAVSDRR